MQRAALERQLEDAVEARQAAQEAAALAQERYLHESWRASEAESAAELAASQREAEEDKVSELESACKDLAGELEQVRSQADVLAQCASALTVPRFKDITRHDISYRTKMRSQHDDKQYLRNIFSEREWRASDVAAVLHETGLLSNVFETKQVRALTVLFPTLWRLTAALFFAAQAWDLRLDWLGGMMTELSKTKWSVNSMVTVMIDNCMSFGDLQKMRQALTLEYSRDHDRFMHPVWVTASCDAHLVRPRFLRAPEPIPPVYLIKEEFRKFQSELKIEISEDGKVASHSFMQKVIELHEQHEAAGMLLEGVGETSDNRHLITYSFDAFPCKGISVEHAVIFSASLKVETQSEQLCKILCAGAIKENNCLLYTSPSPRDS